MQKPDVYELVKDPINWMSRYTIYKNGEFLASTKGGGFFTLKWTAMRRIKQVANGTYVNKKARRVIARATVIEEAGEK